MRRILLACIVAGLATPALAAGPRTLTWPGKPAAAPNAPAAAEAAAPRFHGSGGPAWGLRPLPTAPVQPAVFTPPPGLGRPDVTPQAIAAYAPQAIEAAQAPVPAIAPVAVPRAVQQTAVLAPPPAAAPPPPAPRVAAAPASAPAPLASSSERPRLYSLHREYGETPDRTEMPAPVFLDNLPVDLAAPPPQPLRDKDERRAKADGFDPDAPAGTEQP